MTIVPKANYSSMHSLSNHQWQFSEVEHTHTKIHKHKMILGLGRSPGEGNSSTLQYFCLGNPMDKGAWRGEIPSAAGKKKNNSSIYLCYS